MNDNNGWWLWLVIVVLVIYWGDIWNTKWRYALVDDVSQDKVFIEKEPRDCDFLTAPLGRKGCHYKKVVSITKWAMSTAKAPIVSYDDGKSWYPLTSYAGAQVPQNPTIESVNVSWEKIND